MHIYILKNSKLENSTDDELIMIPMQCTDPLNQTWVDGQQPPECEWSWVDQMNGVSKASGGTSSHPPTLQPCPVQEKAHSIIGNMETFYSAFYAGFMFVNGVIAER